MLRERCWFGERLCFAALRHVPSRRSANDAKIITGNKHTRVSICAKEIIAFRASERLRPEKAHARLVSRGVRGVGGWMGSVAWSGRSAGALGPEHLGVRRHVTAQWWLQGWLQWWARWWARQSVTGAARGVKKGGGGGSSGGQCGFQTRLFLRAIYTFILPTPDAPRMLQKNSSWFGFLLFFFPPHPLYLSSFLTKPHITNSVPRFDWTTTEMKFPIENPRKQVNWDPEQGW